LSLPSGKKWSNDIAKGSKRLDRANWGWQGTNVAATLRGMIKMAKAAVRANGAVAVAVAREKIGQLKGTKISGQGFFVAVPGQVPKKQRQKLCYKNCI